MEPLKIVTDPPTTDDKYIVFKRSDFLAAMEPQARNMATSEVHLKEVESLALPDAVVIRRQDLFASPALATYATTIGMVAVALKKAGARHTEDLLTVADYFQRQSELAADEGWKYPDV